MKEINEEDLKVIWEKLIENEKIDSPSNEDCKKLYIEKFGHEMPEIDFMAMANKKKTKSFRGVLSKAMILMFTFLLLSGCMFIFASPLYTLVKNVFSNNTDISIDTGEGTSDPETIQKIFEIGYLPDGYEEISRNSREYSFKIIFSNGNHEIWFTQRTSTVIKNVDNENTIEHEIIINGKEAHGIYIEKYDNATFIWSQNGYSFELYSSDPSVKIEFFIDMAESLGEPLN